MNSRNKILEAVRKNAPQGFTLPQLSAFEQPFTDAAQKFQTVLEGIGGSVHFVKDYESILPILKQQFSDARRIVTTVPDLRHFAEQDTDYEVAHRLQDVDLTVIHSGLAVAENGAVWVTDAGLPQRVLPFITQHLAVVIKKDCIVPTLHEAYELIADSDYGFGVFIAGPSKTADIEQSLVLGAHGPKSMSLFILQNA